MVGHTRLTKVTIVNSPKKKMPLANLSKNYAALHFVIQNIIVLVSFPKKSPFQAKEEFGPYSVQNYLILYLMICHRVFF